MRKLPAIFGAAIACAALFFPVAAPAIKIRQHSVSSSKQFIVYCDDGPARMDVTTYVEHAKAALLDLLGERDDWKIPIVVNLAQTSSEAVDEPASRVSFFEMDGGSKIELDVWLKTEDPTNIRFEQQVARAMLLEMEYRNKPAMKGGVQYTEPPSWLVEGAVQDMRDRDSGVDPAVYENFMEGNRFPSIKSFLAERDGGEAGASQTVYQACSLSLVRLLAEMPGGRASLAAYIRALPGSSGDIAADLIKQFPALQESSEALEKWWTLGIARLSTADRFRGLSTEQTEQRLAAILSLQIRNAKSGEVKTYSIGDYKDYRKLPESKAALQRLGEEMLALSTEASPLFRPVVLEYQKIVFDLQRGKTHRLDARLATVSKYREMIVNRIGQISDYMNWYEATQIGSVSNSFDGYVRTVNEFSEQQAKRDDPISSYLDAMETQYQ